MKISTYLYVIIVCLGISNNFATVVAMKQRKASAVAVNMWEQKDEIPTSMTMTKDLYEELIKHEIMDLKRRGLQLLQEVAKDSARIEKCCCVKGTVCPCCCILRKFEKKLESYINELSFLITTDSKIDTQKELIVRYMCDITHLNTQITEIRGSITCLGATCCCCLLCCP
jgi:hypothetical protein